MVFSRTRKAARGPRRRWALAAGVLCAAALVVVLVRADVVVLRDGSEIRGHLVSLDEHNAVIDRGDGRRETIPRAEIERIELEAEAPPAPRVLVRIREADDRMELLLDGRPVATYEDLRDGPVDIGPELADGAHLLEGFVINDEGPWSYSWTVDVGGRRLTLSCGRRGRQGCTRGGHNGQERGRLPAGGVWLYADRRQGKVEAQLAR